MRILLMWPSGAPEMKILLEELQNAGHDIVYWVGEHPASHLAPPGCAFHDHYDAWDAKSAEAFSNEQIEPPSAAFIASHHELESIILSAMNKRYDRSPVDERKHVYYTMLGYWNFVLDRCKPEAVVFNDVPHSLYSNVIYELAKGRGVHTIVFEGTLVCNRVISYEDIWKGSDTLRERIAHHRREKLTIADLDAELQTLAHPSKQEVPAYILEQKKRAEGRGLIEHRMRIALKTLLNGTFFRLVASYVARVFQNNLRSEYRALERTPDFSAPFVYFPLSFQPERTTSPQGGVYTDQILAIETLAAALPEKWRIYVKEHPSQWWLRGKTRYSSARYEGYYRRLARIPHVTLIPPRLPSSELLAKAKAVATITGTAGWEALLTGKTPITFGYPWYQDCPGVLRVRSVADCMRALKEIENGARVSEADLAAYLKSVQEVGFITNYASIPARMSAEDELRAYAKAIVAALGEKIRL